MFLRESPQEKIDFRKAKEQREKQKREQNQASNAMPEKEKLKNRVE